VDERGIEMGGLPEKLAEGHHIWSLVVEGSIESRDVMLGRVEA